jgi:hypothetical protein
LFGESESERVGVSESVRVGDIDGVPDIVKVGVIEGVGERERLDAQQGVINKRIKT